MESNAVAMQQKIKFDLHPLERGYKQREITMPNHFTIVGKNLNELEL
jgi:hypothetical protein